MTDSRERVARAHRETERLSRELDITNADHIALWLEANTIPDEPMSQCISWLALQIVEAHERALELSPDVSRESEYDPLLCSHAGSCEDNLRDFGGAFCANLPDPPKATTEGEE
jgi:hypothetical protein